jgi:predicted nucleotidyltransferase
MNSLAEILSSKVRAEFLRLLFGITPRELHLRDIGRLSGLAIGTVQQEAPKLLKLDLIIQRRDGNRCYYKANTAHPLYMHLHEMVLKTSGLADILKKSLEHADIKAAFVFGSVASDTAAAASDIDLLVIGDIGLRALSRRLKEPSLRLGRDINPHVFTIEEFADRKNRRDHFVRSVLEGPRIFIIGNDDELAGMA